MRFCSILFLSFLPLTAQHSETALRNPFQSPDDRARGGAFFLSQCASCHGADGKGGAQGPSLASGTFKHASSDEGLFQVITKGIPGTTMPGFSLNGREIWQIVAYIRSLSAGRTGSATKGDASRGAALVKANRCLNCHWINGEGAERGVNLTWIGSYYSPGELHMALADPSAHVAPEYWTLKATTKDGKSISGRRMNEDTYSVQILLPSGQLQSIQKSNLQEQTLDRNSPMPSFKDKLTEAQRNDVVAYLASLRGNTR